MAFIEEVMMQPAHFVILLVTCGCAVDMADDPDELSETTSNLTAENRIATNRIATNRLALSALSLTALSANKLAVDAMALTADGREVLSYAIGCALTPDQSITANVLGTTYEFRGLVGLAPRWLGGALNSVDRNAISACLIARVNAFGIAVPLSLRGPKLQISPSELETYQIDEGAFWGDVFTGLAPMVMFACTGVDNAEDPSFGTLPLRACARDATACGFNVVGRCDEVCTGVGAIYSNCTTEGRVVLSVRLAGSR